MGINSKNKKTIDDAVIKIAKRSLHTVTQTAIGIIGTSVYLGDVNRKLLFSVCALAGITSVLKSAVIGMPESNV